MTSYHCLNGVVERGRERRYTSLTSHRCIVFFFLLFSRIKIALLSWKMRLIKSISLPILGLRHVCVARDFDAGFVLDADYIIYSVPIVTLNTLITQYILYKKLSRCNYFFSRILEAYRCITFDEKQTFVSIFKQFMWRLNAVKKKLLLS